MLDSIGQIAIVIHDLDRAVEFYRDKLELPLLFQVPPRMAFFQCGPTRLMLSLPEGAEHDHPGSILYFKVADLAATHATLVGRGVAFVSPPHVVHRDPKYELWMAFFQDPDRNSYALMSEEPL